MKGHNLDLLIRGCLKRDRQCQKLLYKQFYSYAMSICMRYTRNYDDAVEVINDSFLKVFMRIEQYDQQREFKGWFRRILINCSIDKIKKEMKTRNQVPVDEIDPPSISISPEGTQDHKEILMLIQKLSPAYRSVFNLYVIDGYTHEEIAKTLGISIGTSKSNLAKARMRLKKFLVQIDKDEYSRYAG